MIAKVCLIEDDPIMGESLHERLLLEGFACDWHRTGHAALQRLGQEPYAAVVSDIRGDALVSPPRHRADDGRTHAWAGPRDIGITIWR